MQNDESFPLQELRMHLDQRRNVLMLGALALAASAVLFSELTRRSRKRRLLREHAVKQLRTSGEFFFSVESIEVSVPVSGESTGPSAASREPADRAAESRSGESLSASGLTNAAYAALKRPGSIDLSATDFLS